MLKSILVFLFFLIVSPSLVAQSCCSGGVPVSSNLGLPASEKGVFQANLAYDLNVLNTLQDRTERLDDRSRKRSTHSFLLELGYSWTKKWSTDLFFSFLRQERRIEQNGLQKDFDKSMGIGDAVVLLKYRAWYRKQGATSLHLGLGSKIPLGAFDQKDDLGIVLSADLQPGSGAWDFLFWGQGSQQLSFRPSMNLIVTTTFALKGENTKFNQTERYAFGDEWLLAMGLSDRILLGKQIWDASTLLRYRTVAADFRNGSKLPSTGGEWLFVNPSISWWWRPNVSFNANVEFPIYARLVGTQATPTYRINVGMYWRRDKKN